MLNIIDVRINPAGNYHSCNLFIFFPCVLPVKQLHFIPMDLGSPIVHCSVADPYVIIMTAEGVVTMFVLKSDSYMGKTHRLSLQKPQISTVSDTHPPLHRHAPCWQNYIVFNQDFKLLFKLNIYLKKTTIYSTAISCDRAVCVPRRKWNVHDRKQSELLQQRRRHQQESVRGGDGLPRHQVGTYITS